MIDRYFSKVYNKVSYNCAHLACEFWKDLTGQDVAEVLRGFLCRPSERKANLSDLRRIQLLDKPVDPCMVFFQATMPATHVGIWWNGRVLHINERGVQYQPIEVVSLCFDRYRFFLCN